MSICLHLVFCFGIMLIDPTDVIVKTDGLTSVFQETPVKTRRSLTLTNGMCPVASRGPLDRFGWEQSPEYTLFFLTCLL